MRWPWKRSKAQAAVTLTSSAGGFLSDFGPVVDDDSDELAHSLWSMPAARMYRRQPAVRSVIDFLATNIAEIHMEVFERLPDGQHVERRDHPLRAILDHPLQGVPRSRFMRQVVGDLALFDRMLVYKQRVGRNPADMGLVRVPLKYVTLRESSIFGVKTFEISRNGQDPLIVPAADAIYVHGYSPTSNANGVSPIETLMQMLREEQAAFKDRENFYRRGPRLGGVIEYPQDAPIPSPEGRQRQREDWNARYQGVNATDAGGVPVLREGARFREVDQQTADEAQFIESRQLLREEVCRAYGIPPQVLGITPANYATADAYHQALYQDALGPWWVWLQEEFEEQLLYADFEDLPSPFFLDFDLEAKLAGSFLDQWKLGQTAVGGPWMTINEFRKRFNMPPIEGGDQIVIPLNTVRGGGPQANPSDAENQFTEAAQLLVSMTAEQLVEVREYLEHREKTNGNGNGHHAKHAKELEVASWPTQES